MTVAAMCSSAGVSRAGYYRHESRPETPDDDMDLRDEIQKIALKWPSYGRRRITAELKRRGWKVNHKHVHRIMREDNLLCLRRRRYVHRQPGIFRTPPADGSRIPLSGRAAARV